MTSGAGAGDATVRAVGYAYTWDYEGDPAAADRAARLGLQSVALAASYHATRAGTPWHPSHRILDAQWAACYVPVLENVWRGRRLVPREPTWTSARDSFTPAQQQLTDRGLAVEAWIVLTHNLELGRRHSDLVVRNAFGDVYPYGLCPAAQDVQEYCLTLVEAILRATSVSGIVLESCGAMGFDHAGEHEKTEFAGWDQTRRALLSLCFCPACIDRYRDAGIDPDRLTTVVRRAVDSEVGTLEEALGALAPSVAEVRTGIAGELRTLLVGRIRAIAPRARITLHASADPWATGSFATVHPALREGLDAVVASCWEVPNGAGRIRDLRELVPSDVDVGAYLRLDRDWGESGTTHLREYLDAGMRELHLYHLGLLGADGLETLRRVVDTTRELVRATRARGR